jgi:hypothetical protein
MPLRSNHYFSPEVLMLRLLLALATGLTLGGLTLAEDKPKLKRIAISDPNDLKDNADFLVQGDYTSGAKDKKSGLQVVAKGEGKFAVKLFNGGLPGDGWDGKVVFDGTAETKSGMTFVTVKAKNIELTGSISDGKFKIEGDSARLDFTKVERKSPTLGALAPKGAIVLFGKEGDEKNWSGGKLVELSDGKFLNNGIKSKAAFGAFTAHVEFRLPWMPNSVGQARANSGVYLQDRYELQVLDSFGLKGENNEAGGFYTLHAPKVNMCYPPMQWQTYDIDFTPAQFEGEKKIKNARTAVKHNGVVIQDDVELKNSTGGGQPENATPGVFQLQNHGDPVVYRNIWVLEKK